MSSSVLSPGRRARLVREAVATTPGLLKTALAADCALALLFAIAVDSGIRGHRQGMQTIGKDSAPSIIAAQQIRSSLADMHSNAANGLIGKPGENREAAKIYEARRLEVTEGILAAARNITYGDKELVPIKTLLQELGHYEELVAQARLLHERRDPDSLLRHREADRLMHENLLPAADDLDNANREELDRGYATARATSWRAMAWVLLAGIALIGALAATQLLLYHRMRRVLNPPLIAASMLAAGFLVYAVTAFATEAHLLKVAKQDAFESIHALQHARAVAYDANGDESRWLLDHSQAAVYEKAFFDKTARLAKRPEGLSFDSLAAKIVGGPLPDEFERFLAAGDADAVRRSVASSLPDGFQGYLADELRNITFPGEREAAIETLKTFARYVKIDGEIRRLEGRGDHTAAVALCVGNDPRQSNWAFTKFDDALGKTLDINQRAFVDSVDRGFKTLAGFDVASPLVALGISLLAYVGLRPRMREYAG
ncbi:MAG: hypothetical protein JOZ53_05970 [Planctomycetaceae bacterium]|nr:hypothetical protein [Planctomycetaceae bacterium]